MPTIFRNGPYRFYWFSNESGEPAHIHVDRDNLSAKFWLQPLRLARNFGYPAHELRRIHTIVESRHKQLLEVWHGNSGI